MELYLRAQDRTEFEEQAADDIFASARKSSPLLDWTFFTRLRACRKNGELTSTLVMVVCACALGGLLMVANAADKVAGLFRS